MPETPLFFDRGPVRLFGVLHEPDVPSAGSPFVFCHPMAEEKLWAHRVFVSFARELARRGRVVLRFDYAGNGDSDLDFSDSSLTTGAADINAAIDLLRARTAAEQVTLLGLRLGGSLACRVAAERKDIDGLILWAPITDGRRYLQEFLRISLTTQMAIYREIRQDRAALVETLDAGGTVNIEGYELSEEMASQLNALALENEPAAAGRTLIVQIERGEPRHPSRDMQALAKHLPGAALEIVQEEPFWFEIQRYYDRAPNLFSKTLQWLGYE